MTADQGAPTFKQQSLPQLTPEGIALGSPPRPEFQAPKRGDFPVGSRTTVPESTQVGLTSVFGMGTGVSPPLWPSNHRYPDSLRNLFNVEPVWTVSSRGLNTSLPRCVHPDPIKRVFYSCPMMPRLGVGFMLRCFQHLSLTAWLPGVALSDNRYTRGCRPLFLSY